MNESTRASLNVANSLCTLFAVLTGICLVGVFATDDWPGTNPFGLFFFLMLFLWIVAYVTGSAIKRPMPVDARTQARQERLRNRRSVIEWND